eukprot:4773923-Pleurochrysis_carterae.AAC.5
MGGPWRSVLQIEHISRVRHKHVHASSLGLHGINCIPHFWIGISPRTCGPRLEGHKYWKDAGRRNRGTCTSRTQKPGDQKTGIIKPGTLSA